ncbi:hypothetical protein SMD11_1213 [Streptomyces albireticuli]|uniref:Uncharacterized protein n=1 Tax=Streptomyces albireticuli TaxID=1940 RepID=A0A1Z2KXV4_9ACTN|nr:hypothetical protein SMD11_1213 [Streptomyces albireticuli]
MMGFPPAIDLGLRPAPVHGCQICIRAAAWRAAYETGRGAPHGYADLAAASGCSQEIRNHPHEPRVFALPIAPPTAVTE